MKKKERKVIKGRIYECEEILPTGSIIVNAKHISIKKVLIPEEEIAITPIDGFGQLRIFRGYDVLREIKNCEKILGEVNVPNNLVLKIHEFLDALEARNKIVAKMMQNLHPMKRAREDLEISDDVRQKSQRFKDTQKEVESLKEEFKKLIK